MRQFLDDLKQFAFDIFFPISCLFCNVQNSVLCQSCLYQLRHVDHQVCIMCRRASLDGITHASCRTPHSPDGLLSLFDYHDDRIAQAIIYGKYKFIPSIYKVLGNTMSEWLIKEQLASMYHDFLIVPLPLARSRKRWRGFNQAEILAHELSTALTIPAANMLARTRATKTQKDLNKDSRQKNIEGAFALASKAGRPWYHLFVETNTALPPDIKNKNIILVDDVITTGSTLREAVKVLKRNGAAKVWCITIARD